MNRVIIKHPDERLYRYHLDYLKNPMLARILANRHIEGRLPTKNDPLIDPFEFKDMRAVVEYLDSVIRTEPESIIVHNDYDNDGFSGALIFLSFIKEKYGVELDFYINSRNDGYEMTPEVIDRFIEMNKKVIITIDKGISSYEGISYAKSKGMRVIVTDHHQPKLDSEGNKLRSEADYIICHTLEENRKSQVQICGAATTWYLCRAIDENLAMKYVDIAGIATIVDMVPMNDTENRKIVLKALDKIRNGQFSNKNYALF